MRIDDAGPRTWLLGAVAAWALGLWLLAVAGMGGRIAPLEADASLEQPLPEPVPAAAGRLGPATDYATISARPLLSPDRRPQPFSLQPEREGEPTEERFDFVLTGVLLTPELKLAIIQPVGGGESIRLRMGQSPETAPSWRLVALSSRGAVFEGPGGEQSLELRSYDGGADLRRAAPATSSRRPDAMADAPMPDASMPDAPVPTEVDAADAAPGMEDADAATTPQAQMEAIRKRIEARREQLRREARQPPPPQQR